MKQVKSIIPKHWPKRLQSYVGGQFVESKSGQVYSNIYAATGQKILEYEIADVDQVDAAIAVAKRAQVEWAKWTPIERGKVLKRAAVLLEERNDELAALEAIDTSRYSANFVSI